MKPSVTRVKWRQYTSMFCIQNCSPSWKCLSWDALSLLVSGYWGKAAGMWSQFSCSAEIKNAGSSSSTPPYAFQVCTGTILPSPLCNWPPLVTVSPIRPGRITPGEDRCPVVPGDDKYLSCYNCSIAGHVMRYSAHSAGPAVAVVCATQYWKYFGA
jgi:hypothetical protein